VGEGQDKGCEVERVENQDGRDNKEDKRCKGKDERARAAVVKQVDPEHSLLQCDTHVTYLQHLEKRKKKKEN
jgi:hypothetical protein